MKNKITYIIFASAVLGLAVLNSCKKGYESEPLERQSGEYIWDELDSLGNNANKFLTNIYSNLPQGYARVSSDFLDVATGDAISSATSITPITNVLNGGGYDLFTNFEDVFAKNYKGIRQVNILLQNVDKVPLKETYNGLKLNTVWKAEARFLRAFFYFELIKRYGGMPLVGDEVKKVDDQVLIPRNSFEESVNYIVAECDAIKDELRLDPIDDANLGRATKGAALALKARVLLYAASPLYNHQGDAGLPAGNDAQKRVAGYTSYNAERWNLAATAAQDVINYNKFVLESNYRNVFTNRTSREVIFARNDNPNTSVEGSHGPVGLGNNPRGGGRTSPTLEFVNAFGTINGKPITEDVQSSSNPTGYDAANPYANRDPRLNLSIFRNGSQWLNSTVETFDGGRSKPLGTIQQTQTSFYLKKFMGAFETATDYASTGHNWIYFRYGEVYLNLAEALNEYLDQPSSAVYNALIETRRRAGIQKGTGVYGYGLADNLTKEEMRKVIHNERRIELSFEEHRFYDIRRWLTAQDVLSQPLHGYRILRSNAGVLTTQIIEVARPSFGNARRYLQPIPYNEIVRNPLLVQNPGW